MEEEKKKAIKMIGTIDSIKLSTDRDSGEPFTYFSQGSEMYINYVDFVSVKNMMNNQDVNDLKGVQVHSKSPEPDYLVVGKEITFELGQTQKGADRAYKPTDPVKAKQYTKSKGKGATTSSYNDPVEIKRSGRSMAREVAIKYFKDMKQTDKTKKDLEGAVNAIYSWLMQVETLKRDSVVQRYHCIQQAIECISFSEFHIADANNIMDLANEFVKSLDNVD